MSVAWVGLYQFVNVIMMYKVARKIMKVNKEQLYATSSTVFSLRSASLLFSDIFVLSSAETWMRHLSKEYMNNRYVRLLKAKGMPQI